jgi:hypothetical protein
MNRPIRISREHHVLPLSESAVDSDQPLRCIGWRRLVDPSPAPEATLFGEWFFGAWMGL